MTRGATIVLLPGCRGHKRRWPQTPNPSCGFAAPIDKLLGHRRNFPAFVRLRSGWSHPTPARAAGPGNVRARPLIFSSGEVAAYAVARRFRQHRPMLRPRTPSNPRISDEGSGTEVKL
jgi:hypothetical protein